MKTYAGIGSRQAPADVCAFLTRVALRLQSHGYVLRSGGAEGADKAFEAGAGNAKEIFLPWKGFNENRSPLYMDNPKAMEIAEKLHPAWDKLSPAAKKMMARNAHQILGKDLNNPVRFVVCWTPNGTGSGGTGQAIRHARSLQIPVIDFGAGIVKENLDRLQVLVSK